jgi:hypothetical protein
MPRKVKSIYHSVRRTKIPTAPSSIIHCVQYVRVVSPKSGQFYWRGKEEVVAPQFYAARTVEARAPYVILGS